MTTWAAILILALSAPAQAAAPSARMKLDHARIRATAERLAGAPGDIAQRAVFLRQLFEDSRGNNAFPLIALHGALWAHGFFKSREHLEKLDAVGRFADSLRAANRQVFVDTYTNFHFTRAHGAMPGADAFLNPDLLASLNRVHAAISTGRKLERTERRRVFEQSLLWEQETSVARRVDEAVREFGHPLIAFFALMPSVRFSYFPAGVRFRFRDFSDTKERIQYALRAYDIAETLDEDDNASWAAVTRAIRAYGVLPEAYFADPAGYSRRLFETLSTKPVASPRQDH